MAAIKAHKGGRTESFPGTRVRPETLAAIRADCEQRELSIGDWVEYYGTSLSADARRLITGLSVKIEAGGNKYTAAWDSRGYWVVNRISTIGLAHTFEEAMEIIARDAASE